MQNKQHSNHLSDKKRDSIRPIDVWNLFSTVSDTVFYLELFHHARQYIGNNGECCHAVSVQIVSARLGLIKDCVEPFGKRAAELVGDNRIVHGGNNGSIWVCF